MRLGLYFRRCLEEQPFDSQGLGPYINLRRSTAPFWPNRWIHGSPTPRLRSPLPGGSYTANAGVPSSRTSVRQRTMCFDSESTARTRRNAQQGSGRVRRSGDAIDHVIDRISVRFESVASTESVGEGATQPYRDVEDFHDPASGEPSHRYLCRPWRTTSAAERVKQEDVPLRLGQCLAACAEEGPHGPRPWQRYNADR